MIKIRNPFKGFTKFEWALWISSLAAITATHFAVGGGDTLSLVASLIGVTSLIYAARGDVIAPCLFIAFAIIYAVISYFSGYYGEMIIYLGMQLPISCVSLVSWFKNRGEGARVKISALTWKKLLFALGLAAIITVPFYFLLEYFNTLNLIPSTVSVATSVTALCLMALRIPQFALAFILNDIVMIVLWSLTLSTSLEHISLVVCFSIFLINDGYTFINWLRKARSSRGQVS